MDQLEKQLEEIERHFESYEKNEITLSELKKILRSEILFVWRNAVDEGKKYGR